MATIYYRFGSNSITNDYYGYVAHGLLERADTLPELATLLQRYELHKSSTLYQRAAYYNATLGTTEEGRSQARVLERLRKWLTNSSQALPAATIN